MKKLALTIFVILGLTGVAQAKDDSILTMPVTAPCLPTSVAELSLLTEYKEQPMAEGEAVVWNSKVEEYVQVKMKIFVNPKTFSFTVAFEVPNDKLTCFLSTGDNFRPSNQGSRP